MELKPHSSPLARPIAEIFLLKLELAQNEPKYKYRISSAQLWVEMIQHLETQVKYPPQWALVTQHGGCLALLESDTWNSNQIRVEIHYHWDSFEIRYRMSDAVAPWTGASGSWMCGISSSLEQAGQMVVTGLNNAATNLPL